METSFYCPFCHGQLYINERIVLSARTASGHQGLVLLTSDLGDYRAIRHPEFKVAEGEHVDFYCPICHTNLIVEHNERAYTRVMMLEAGEEYEVLFSQVAGQRATYVIGESTVRGYGDDADENTNFWGATPQY